ncbi:MAG: hypothetical protein ACE5Z5_09730 [Candidatus Bathyarchaeia archaeon]
MEFPDNLSSQEERSAAKRLIEGGYRHEVEVVGRAGLKRKVVEAFEVLRLAGYYDFFRSYIRRVVEVEGLSQLREAEATLWISNVKVEEPVEAGRFFVQKAEQMRSYLEGLDTYLGVVERRTVMKSLEFLGALRDRVGDEDVRRRCGELLEEWAESYAL